MYDHNPEYHDRNHLNPVRGMVHEIIDGDPQKETYCHMIKITLCPKFKIISFTTIITFILTIIFIIQILVDGLLVPGYFLQINPNGIISTNFAKNPPSMYYYLKYYQLLTAIFIENDGQHLIFFIIFQLIIGSLVEHLVGSFKIIIIFFASGMAANFFSSAVDHVSVSMGASVALFGEIGALLAFIVIYWSYFDRMTKYSLVIFMIIILLYTLTASSSLVEMYGHLGGFLFGGGLGLALIDGSQHEHHKKLQYAGIAVCGGILFISFLLFFFSDWM